jgi:hypothetical protein
MEEARYSFNVRFNLNGFDSQVTVRADEGWLQCLKELTEILRHLEGLGAKPDRRWEAVKNGNNGAVQPALVPVARVCPVCGKDDDLRLISFANGGKQISKLKCQRCNKWLPSKMQPGEDELKELLAKQAAADQKLWD